MIAMTVTQMWLLLIAAGITGHATIQYVLDRHAARRGNR